MSHIVNKTVIADGFRFREQSVNPDPPTTGFRLLFVKNNGTYEIDSNGVVTGPFGSGGGGGTPGGSNKNIQYNNSGAFGGIANNASATKEYLQQVSSGTPAYAQVADADLSTTDITTNNVSTSKHGFTPKLPNDATKYLDGTGAYTTPAGGGGASYGQTLNYPTSFSGDIINGSSVTPFVDVTPFDVKAVLNSRILHLVTRNASQDQRVRVTLGTTKAGAFDVAVCMTVSGSFWSDNAGDYYGEVRLSTAADGQIAIARIIPVANPSTSPRNSVTKLRVGGSSITSAGANLEPACPIGETVTFRFVRDGSNVISFYYGFGTAPMALAQVIDDANNAPFSATVSGTLARIEFAQHSPSGPTSTSQIEMFVDYLESL